jgi:hypothetical protein
VFSASALSVVVLSTWLSATSWGDSPPVTDGQWALDSRWAFDGHARHQAADPTSGRAERWRRPLHEIPLEDTRDEGKYPPDRATELDAEAVGGQGDGPPKQRWSGSLLQWAASELDHQPLYFDDVPLERYGQSVCPCLQPFFSAARFYGSLPVLPYKVGLDPPCDCVSTLGHYRVGTCAPPTHQTLPLDCRAAFLEGGAWVGLVFLLP